MNSLIQSANTLLRLLFACLDLCLFNYYNQLAIIPFCAILVLAQK